MSLVDGAVADWAVFKTALVGVLMRVACGGVGWNVLNPECEFGVFGVSLSLDCVTWMVEDELLYLVDCVPDMWL